MGFFDIAGGIIGGFANGLMGNMIQASENSANRKFNAQQASLQRQFQRDIMHEQMAYNDPSAYMKRLQNAGLNPNLAVGGLNGQAPSAGTGSSASYNNGVTPQTLFDPNFMLQSKLVDAQINKLNADADKTNAETPWIDRLNSVQEKLSKQGINVEIARESNLYADSDLKDKSGFKVLKELETLDKQITLLGDQHDLNMQQIDINKVRLKYEELFKDVEYRRACAALDIDETNASYLGMILACQIKESQSRTALNSATAQNINFGNAINEAKKQLVGIDKLADYQLKQIQASLDLIQNTITNNTRNTDINEFNSRLGAINTLLNGFNMIMSNYRENVMLGANAVGAILK